MACKNCHVSEWFKNRPKPDCRVRYDLEHCDNPVTRWVYKCILENRQKDGNHIECPFKDK